jgi:DDE family transposase
MASRSSRGGRSSRSGRRGKGAAAAAVKAKAKKGKRAKRAKRAEAKGGSYQGQLLNAIGALLPRGLATVSSDRRVRWTERLLVVCAILVAWGHEPALVDRFAAARACLVQMFPTRRRPGETYEGFIEALEKVSWGLLGRVAGHLRGLVRGAAVAAGCWETCGWVAFGADGSKIDCPMTRANEVGLGLASRANSWPQMLLALMFHAGSGLAWDFRRGGARASERELLLGMLASLPAKALLLLDAGFTGYELLRSILLGDRSFLVRVGSNVRLLTKLGYAAEEREGLVYLWPKEKQKKQCEPLVLRLITFTDGRNRRMHLLTNVLCPLRLSDASALQLYRLRWGAELMYRSLKQTLGKRKMLSDCPEHAAVELDWATAGLWMLDLMNARQAGLSVKRGVAPSLRAVRSAMAGRDPCSGRGHGHGQGQGQGQGRGARVGRLAAALARSTGDGYRRLKPKKARHYPQKKREKPPGDPKARTATDAEVLLAKEIREELAAKSFAA